MRTPSNADEQLIAADNVRVVALDVTDSDSIASAVRESGDWLGAVDVLVNGAGFAQRGTLEEVTIEQVRAQFETNVFGAIAVTQAVLPRMRSRRMGHIINISSVGGVQALPAMNAYSSSKFALEGMSESLAAEVAHLGIRVTIIEPAAFDTNFGSAILEPAHPMAEYEPATQALHAFDDYKQGNIDRAAAAIVSIAGQPDAPLRLVVGHGMHLTRNKIAAQLDEYAAWQELTDTTL
jgi:NAD(P)-dependent dehydrogenase (short-subunit alcohol dehydrogenase family)